jgi:SM-20-related protein
VERLFNKIVDDLIRDGYSINPGALPNELCDGLINHLNQMQNEQFSLAGIGRGDDHLTRKDIRKDKICWIIGESAAGREWLEWAGKLQQEINRNLFMGLFSFESHFAHYQPGDFYLKHYDAFRGQQNRVLTVVAYFNRDWQEEEGGELVMYLNDDDTQGITVLPEMGTVVVFLSEEFPHEVKPASRDRYSIAGWYRVNNPNSLVA